MNDDIIEWSNDNLTYNSFHDACDDAITNKKAIVISSNTTITITSNIIIKNNSNTLIIKGKCSNDEDRPVIIGSGHSVFQVGGRKTSLVLDNITIIHTCDRDDKSDIGGCVFGLYKSNITINNCNLISNHGFSVWAVQQCMVSVSSSSICSKSRSGCVIFGKSNAIFDTVTIYDCKQHGLCSRGETNVVINNSIIKNSGVRGVYSYHNVTLTMNNCIVTTTTNKNAAAIDCWSISNYDATGIINTYMHNHFY